MLTHPGAAGTCPPYAASHSLPDERTLFLCRHAICLVTCKQPFTAWTFGEQPASKKSTAGLEVSANLMVCLQTLVAAGGVTLVAAGGVTLVAAGGVTLVAGAEATLVAGAEASLVAGDPLGVAAADVSMPLPLPFWGLPRQAFWDLGC